MQYFLIVLTNLTQAFFFSLCVLDMKKNIWIRLKCLLVSMSSQTMPTQTSALCLFSDCHALFASLGERVNTNTHKLTRFVGSEGKEEQKDGEEWINEGIFLLKCDIQQSAECMWKPNPLCPSSPNKLCIIVWVLYSLSVYLFPFLLCAGCKDFIFLWYILL